MIAPTLLGCALMLARGAAQLSSSALVVSAKTPRVAAAAPSRPSGRALAEAILARNVFDAQTGPLSWQDSPPQPAASGPATPQELEGEPPVCDGALRLVGAMVVPHEPGLSFASIAEGAATHLYHPGMKVGDREVVGIREQRVFLRGASAGTCQLGMFVAPATESSRAAPAAAPPGRAAPHDHGITRVGEHSYRVPRALFQQAVAGGGLGSSVRVLPHRDGGRPAGLKLAGVRPGSMLQQLGLASSDVLLRINDHELTEPDRALAAYAELRTADRFTLIVARDGVSRSVQYTVE
jgi:general secretion pathway protein C